MFAIAMNDYGTTVYWTTRLRNTDNYTTDPADATRFKDKCFAVALMETLGLDDDHKVVKL